MSNLTLRSLRPEDLDRVAAVESRITGSPRKVFLEKLLATAMAAPDNFITCAALDCDTVAGYGFARVQSGEFGVSSAVVVLEVLGVDPDRRGQGVGTAVVSGIEERMRKKGIRTLKTQVLWSDHAMVRFFSSGGFTLASSRIIERDTSPLAEEVAEVAPVKMDGRWQVHSGESGNYYEKLSRDRVPVRSLKQDDLAAVIRIDRKLTGFDRSDYFSAKFREMLVESGIRVSLVAEDHGLVSGFVMARVDFGEFGRVDKAAVLDTIGVHPAYKGSGIGHALLSQLLLNLATLQVESLRTQVRWEHFDLQRFLHLRGFGTSQRLVLTKTIS